MATRFHFNGNATTGVAGVTAPGPLTAEWSATANHVVTTYSGANARKLTLPKGTGASTTLTPSPQPDTADHLVVDKACWAQFVGPVMPAQSFAQGVTISGQMRFSETTAGCNIYPAFKVYLLNADGDTALATLIPVTLMSASEMGTTLTNKSFSATIDAGHAYTATEDCRICVEIGCGNQAGVPPVAGSGVQGHIGTIHTIETAASDLAVDNSTTTANNPWLEFSSDLLQYVIFTASPLSAGHPVLGAPDCTPPMQNIFTGTPTTNNIDAGSWRMTIPVTHGGRRVRVRFRAGTDNHFKCDHCSVGIWAGTIANTTATPIELTFGGASGMDIPLGTTRWSDIIDLGTPFTTSDKLVVIMDMNGADAGDACKGSFATTASLTLIASASYNLATPPAGTTWTGEFDGFDQVETIDEPAYWTIVDQSAGAPATSDGGGDALMNIRSVFHAADYLSTPSGKRECRVAVCWGSDCGVVSNALTSMYFGQAASSGDAYDYNGNQVQVKFGTATTLTSGPAKVDYSDWFTLGEDFDGTKNYVASAYFANNAGITISEQTSNVVGDRYWGQNGNNQAALTDATSGYSTVANDVAFFVRFDVRAVQPVILTASPLVAGDPVLGAPVLTPQEEQPNHDTLTPAPLVVGALTIATPLLSFKYVLGQQSFAIGSLSLGAPYLQSPPGTAVPELVQFVALSCNIPGYGNAGNNYKFKTPNSIGADNLLVIDLTYAHGSAPTSISDADGNSWSTTPVVSADAGVGNYVAARFACEKAVGGSVPNQITIGFSGNVQPFTARFQEWCNIATSSAADGSHSAANVAAPDLAAGSFTPNTDNDANGGHLILGYFGLAGGTGADIPTNWSPGSGFTLLDGDLAGTSNQSFYQASEYQILSTRAAVNPGMTATNDTGNSYNCIATAFKVAAAGTPKPSGIRVNRVYHFTDTTPPSTWNLQTPMSGGTRILTTSAQGVSSVTDSENNTWTSVSGGEDAQLYYLKNASPNPNLVTTVHGATGATGTSVRVYDVSGADADPFDGMVHNALSLDGLTSYAGPTGAPTYANGLAIGVLQLGNGPGLAITSPAGATWDLCTYDNEIDVDPMENADGNAHFYYSSTASQTWNWTITSRGTNSGSCLVAFFKAAASNHDTLTAAPLSAGQPALPASVFTQKQVLGQQSFSTASPSLGTVTFAQRQVLTAAYGITSPVLGAPVLSQSNALTASPLSAGQPSLGTATFTQKQVVTAAYGISPPTLPAPQLSIKYVLGQQSFSTASPSLGAPVVAQTNALSAAPLSAGQPVLSAPVFTQKQVLTAAYSISSPNLGSVVFKQDHEFTPNTISIAALILGAPVLTPSGAKTFMLGDRVLDYGLSALDSECDRIHVCAGMPETWEEVGTKTLGYRSFSPGDAFGPVGAGAPSGRLVSSVAIGDGDVNADGSVTHWAAVDNANSRFLASGQLTGGKAVTTGQKFTLGSIPIHIDGGLT